MSSKYNLIIILLTICSCNNSDPRKKPALDTSSSQTVSKQVTESGSQLNIAGEYSFGDDVEKGAIGSVKIYPLTGNSALFYLDLNRGAPSYNMGQLFGKMTIKDKIGIYDSKLADESMDCLIKFEFKGDELKITTGEGRDDCGFGHAVYAENIYKRTDTSIPEYFINAEGDTIAFKGLIN